MRVLVTGGSGFIGSHVMDVLGAEGHIGCNFDVKRPTFRRHDNSWFEGDLLDLESLERSLTEFRPDIIMHLAARAEIQSSAWEDFASIHQGTRNLLAAIEGYGQLTRLLNVSTQLTIGPGHDPRGPLDFKPYTVYGEAKAFAEGLLFQWQSEVPWLTVRPATIWGPYHPSLASAIWKYIGSGHYIQAVADAPILRSYGFVRNTAKQMVDLILKPPAITSRQVYYLADEVMDSAIWADAFSVRLRGKPATRVPAALLHLLGYAGDAAAKLGRPVPIDSGRVQRLTQSYPVPLEPTFSLIGLPVIPFEAGVDESVEWLLAGAPREAR
ncbi:NAD-dependent epimerase/dehydratase family protein [Phenylobacterium sp. VNQ135]|uniref:NAD-dependent epimerase/dehydratase family protein n=1 Tax=Phenylobacterium sp. VNQ135 TaxID=3400922 RepID=UPI003C0DCF16